MSAREWRKKGDREFIKGNWSEASSHYTNALKLLEDNAEKAVYYKCRAAAYLKLHDYKKVVQDCDSALKICGNKEIYRRCQALRALGISEEAYRDTEIIIPSGPNEKVIQPVATRLLEIIQECHMENLHISDKVSQMLDLALDVSADEEKRETAMNDLLVFVRDRAGAEEIFKKENISKIAQLEKVEKNEEVISNAIRIIGELLKNNISRIESIMTDVLPWCLEMMNSASTERVKASKYCLQNILNTYSGISEEPDSKSNKALYEVHKKEIDTILSCLLNSVTSRTITGLARDAIIELIMYNIRCVTALDWAERFIELRGLQRLMEVASEVEEYKYESSMDITSSTRTIISVCLAKIYENVYCVAAKEKFSNAINEFIKDKLLSPDTESKVRVVLAITTLLLVPLDVGTAVVFQKEIFEMILRMSETDDVLQQKVVCEYIVAAMTKYNKVNVYIWRNLKILEKLYQAKDDSIRIRAFVGLCKLSRFYKYKIYDSLLGYTTITLFSHGATKKLAKVCRQFLINPEKEKDMRKWAIIGLSYLTLDIAVREQLIEDRDAIQAMIELTKTDDQSVLYGVLITLVNLCTIYNEQEHIPEMIELFAEHHFEEHDLIDDANAVKRRQCVLAMAGVTKVLVETAAKTDSQNCKELIARVFYAICIPEEMREVVVQQGGTEALLSFALDGTDKEKKYASRALIRLGLTIQPEVVFPGQRMKEVVRLFINLLNPECSVLENCETLRVLHNLAGVNDSMRRCLFNEGGFSKFYSYMCTDYHSLKRASALLLENLTSCRDVAVQCFKEDSYRVSSLVLDISLEIGDEDTCKALAGTLAMLTTISNKACEEVVKSDSWPVPLRFLLADINAEIQHRGITIVLNMMRSSKDVAARFIKTGIMELLWALIKNDTVGNKKIKQLAFITLEVAAENIYNT